MSKNKNKNSGGDNGGGDHPGLNVLSISLNEAHDLMCAIVVRFLRDNDWSAGEVEAAAPRTVSRLAQVCENDDFLAALAKDAAVMKMGGASDEQVRVMANAGFAIRAVRIAEDLNRGRIASMN